RCMMSGYEREQRGNTTGGAGRAGPSLDGAVGKRTLTEQLPAPGGEAAVQRREAKQALPKADIAGTKDDSARFEGDKTLEKVGAGKKILKHGSTGLQVTKIQRVAEASRAGRVDLRHPQR